MGKFSIKTPEKQAKSIEKALDKSGEISSVRTLFNYTERLEQIANNLAEFNIGNELRDMTPETAKQYLEIRASEVNQKTLDMERQALQAMLTHVTNKLPLNEKLDVVKSELQQILSSRSYTPEQIELVTSAQSEKNSLATQIVYASGLRAHELLTLAPKSEQNADTRPTLESKFSGRTGQIYTVVGKGGLIREVLIPRELANKLEMNRLPSPVNIKDRNVNYTQRYNIGGGQRWSNSYSRASKKELNWSAGAHGTRHSYAQERMNELQNLGFGKEVALETVSQELGHFRAEITNVYLR